MVSLILAGWTVSCVKDGLYFIVNGVDAALTPIQIVSLWMAIAYNFNIIQFAQQYEIIVFVSSPYKS